MKIAKKRPFFARLQQSIDLVSDNRSRYPVPPLNVLRRLIWRAMKEGSYLHAELAVLWCECEEAREFNRVYRNKDYATNVLSFALDEGEAPFKRADTLRGDLIFCPQVIEEEAKSQGKALEAHYAHLVIHGVLHLMGFDHIEDGEAEEMEALEVRLLQQLGYDDPYRSERAD